MIKMSDEEEMEQEEKIDASAETMPVAVDDTPEGRVNAFRKAVRQKPTRTYYAVQDADLLQEADMERGLFIAASTFLDSQTTTNDIYAEVIRSLELAKNFLYKYENSSSPILGRVDEVVMDAANGIDLGTLREEYEEVRKLILERALALGFGRESEEKYEWEYKMPMQSQIPITPTLNSFLSQKRPKSGKSAISSTTPSAHPN